MHQSGNGKPLLSIIVPAHNEEKRIRGTLEDIRRELPDAEICVVANNCMDRTVNLVHELSAQDKLLTYIDIPAVVGKGGAVRAGFKLVRGEIVAFVDADGATSGAELRRLVGHIGSADGVIASRWKKGAVVETQQSLKRRFLSRGFNAIVRGLFGLPYSDTQCGAKIFRRSAIQEAMTLVETSDFSFDVDLLYQLRRLCKQILEVPSRWSDRAGSSVNVRKAVPRMLASMVRLRLKYSPFRAIVPLLDRLTKLKPIAARQRLHILVCSERSPNDTAASVTEQQFFALCASLQGAQYNFTWCASGKRRAAVPRSDEIREVSIGGARLARLRLPLIYLRDLKDRFDCIVELSSSGQLWWTPLFSLKPKIVVAPLIERLPSLYGDTVLRRSVPRTTDELSQLIRGAIVQEGPRFCAEQDGSWVLLERDNGTTMRRLRIFAIAHAQSALHVGDPIGNGSAKSDVDVVGSV